jgi:hypothetical protein
MRYRSRVLTSQNSELWVDSGMSSFFGISAFLRVSLMCSKSLSYTFNAPMDSSLILCVVGFTKT